MQRGVDRAAFLRHPVDEWRAAIDLLLAQGEFRAATFATESLLALHPDNQHVQTLRRVLHNVPGVAPRSLFRDDRNREVQVAACPGADTALLVFSDVYHSVGAPFALAHQWLGQLPAHVIYLRDLSGLWFMSGIVSLGLSRAIGIERLRAMIVSLGARRVMCFSNSSGGLAALTWGIALGAQRVACMAGAFDASAIKSIAGHKALPAISDVDPRESLAMAAHPPDVSIFVGDANWDDRLHADYLADAPSVTVRYLDDFAGHFVTVEMMARGRFGEVADWLAAPSPSLDQGKK
jgi:hypothetical protein